MKRIIIILIAVLILVAGYSAQNVNMYIEAEPTTDLKNVPITLYMDNDVQFVYLHATFALLEGLTKDKFYYDEDEGIYFSLSNRATKNHKIEPTLNKNK